MSAFAVTGDHGPNLFRLAIEFTILSVAAVVVAALAWFVPPLREWLTQTLAFGWLPAGLYATAALLVLLHRPLNLFTGWRWWLAAALFVGILIGAAGFVRGESGPLYAYGMSGAWGYALTGGNAVVAILEFAVAAALIGLLVIPHSVRWYWTCRPVHRCRPVDRNGGCRQGSGSRRPLVLRRHGRCCAGYRRSHQRSPGKRVGA